MQYQSPGLFTICALCMKQNISYLGHAHHAIKHYRQLLTNFFVIRSIIKIPHEIEIENYKIIKGNLLINAEK